MAAIDSTKKSSRLLQSRRYTHDTYTDAQEAFTSTLDINANEVYVDQSLIPSSGLPYSGSGQNGNVYTVDGRNVVKYWYRQPLTKSDLNNEVWFFLNPEGAAGGIGAQIIDSNQLTNFVSPKYSVPALANANTEDATPGYGVKVIVNGTQVSINNYAFDYKTGVLQFATTALAPTAGQTVTITAYQYVGRVLTDNITNVSSSIAAISASLGGGGGGAGIGDRVANLEIVSASVNSFTASASTRLDRIQESTASLNTFTGSTFPSFSTSVDSRLDTLEGIGTIQGVGTGNSVTFASLQTSGNATIAGDLTVLGNTVTMNVGQLVIEDKLITLASGSTNSTMADGAGFEVAGANVSMSFDNSYSGFKVNTKVSASVFESPTGSFAQLTLSSGSIGTSKRLMFRNEANLNRVEYVPTASVSGDLLQWNGTDFIMSNTIDGGSF